MRLATAVVRSRGVLRRFGPKMPVQAEGAAQGVCPLCQAVLIHWAGSIVPIR
jgi:hypothetical protein